MKSEVALVSQVFLAVPLISKPCCALTKRERCILILINKLTETPNPAFALELCSSSVSSHAITALLFAFAQVDYLDGDVIDDVVHCSCRSVWYLCCGPRCARKFVDLIGGDMLGRALALSMEAAANKGESCPFWASCLSDLTMASSNCLMMSTGEQSKSILQRLSKRHCLDHLFFAAFGTTKEAHMHATLDEFVCRFTSLLLQMSHKAFILEEAEVVTGAFAEMFDNQFFEAVCSYFASYCLRNTSGVSSRVIVALLCLLLLNCAFDPETLCDGKKRESLWRVVVAASNFEARPGFEEAYDLIVDAVQTSLDERTPVELFTIFSPFDYSSGLLSLHSDERPLCMWCGMIEPALLCTICKEARFCSSLCQDLHEPLHQKSCTKE